MANNASNMMMMMMICACMVFCMMCMMGPFGELFKGLGSLAGATGNLLGGVTGGAAKGVNFLGDVVTGDAFKGGGNIKRAPKPVEDQVMKLVEHGRKLEAQRKIEEAEEKQRQQQHKDEEMWKAIRAGPTRM